MEHYRLHTVESWPESAFKQATLAAINCSLASLGDGFGGECAVCALRSSTALAAD